MENLFTKTPVVDKRQSAHVPITPGRAKPVVPPLESGLFTSKKKVSPKMVVLATGIIALLLSLQVNWKQYLTGFLELHKDRPAESQASIISRIVVKQPSVMVSVSAVLHNEVSGMPVNQLEDIGGKWLAAQERGAFTVELLRTDDLKKVEDIAPLDEGQPLFLVRLVGPGRSGFAVLSGVYESEAQAKQVAARSANYHAMRIGDFR